MLCPSAHLICNSALRVRDFFLIEADEHSRSAVWAYWSIGTFRKDKVLPSVHHVHTRLVLEGIRIYLSPRFCYIHSCDSQLFRQILLKSVLHVV